MGRLWMTACGLRPIGGTPTEEFGKFQFSSLFFFFLNLNFQFFFNHLTIYSSLLLQKKIIIPHLTSQK